MTCVMAAGGWMGLKGASSLPEGCCSLTFIICKISKPGRDRQQPTSITFKNSNLNMFTSVTMNNPTCGRKHNRRCRRGFFKKKIYTHLGHGGLQDHIPRWQRGCAENRRHHHQNIWSARWTVCGEMQQKADPVSLARRHGTQLT